MLSVSDANVGTRSVVGQVLLRNPLATTPCNDLEVSGARVLQIM